MLKPICDGYEKAESGPCIRYIKGGFCTLPMIFRCTEYLRNNEPTLSYSSIKDFVCPKKFYYSYIVGLELIDKSLPLQMGTVADHILRLLHGESPTTFDLDTHFIQYQDNQGDMKPWLWAMWGLFDGYIAKQYDLIKGTCQSPFQWSEDSYPNIRGFIDLIYDTIAYEFKYTSRPDSYTKFTVSDQLGTYFLGNPNLQRITLRAIQVPQLKQSAKESGSQYRDRVRLDFVSRPNYYIHDSNYWRTEFDLDAVKLRAKRIAKCIHSFTNDGIEGYYQNISPDTCFGSFRCDYISICESGAISDTLYRKRDINPV